MGGWPGKYVIGLTGNIATGKSVVRKMLEHLGAFGIDADALAHQVIKKGAPGYQPVLETFGKWVLAADGEIDRSRLGWLVFSDREALKLLEGIIHPHVGLAVNLLVTRSSQAAVVIEAIKLLESGLATLCDTVWTVYSPRDTQIARLVEKRGMSDTEAATRVDAQPSQEEKKSAADIVISNDGVYDETWKQVYKAWQATFLAAQKAPTRKGASSHVFEVKRAGPGEAGQVAQLIERLSGGTRQLTSEQVMRAFGEKAYLLLQKNGIPSGIIGWQVENLVARIDDVYIDDNLPQELALSLLLKEAEHASRDLYCEISLLILPLKLKALEGIFTSLGYSSQPFQGLGVPAWEEAARESSSTETYVLYKQLRADRITKPV